MSGPVRREAVDAAFPAFEDGRGLEAARVWCVGRNYADHAREMGSTEAEVPFFFSKPTTSLTGAAGVEYPPQTEELHHEVELVVALGRGGRDLDTAAAGDCIVAVGVGVDLTRRCAQARAKAAGRPWDLAKGFDQSAPLGPLVAWPAEGFPEDTPIELAVNGRLRQSGRLGQMIHAPSMLLARLSREVRLLPGDLLFTGTPAGVGPLVAGDRVRAWIGTLPELTFSIHGPE